MIGSASRLGGCIAPLRALRLAVVTLLMLAPRVGAADQGAAAAGSVAQEPGAAGAPPTTPTPEATPAPCAGPTPQGPESTPAAQPEEPAVRVCYRERKLEIASADGNFLLEIQWRAQLRYAHPFDADPQIPDEFTQPGGSSFSVRRARLKVGGHAYRPWLDYYLEYDFPSTSLLDWRFTLERWPALQLRVGQWKVPFSRERITSSGQQQLVERSIVNDYFTLDRQQGVLLQGRVLRGTPGDAWYHAGVFTGMGRGGGTNDDGELLWLGRLQWDPLGRDPGFADSDVERTPKPALSLAGAVAYNRSPFTRFSSSGGGQLPGFAPGVASQYAIEQWLFETAFKSRGLFFKSESHWKRIDDRVRATTTRMSGGYLEAGYFPNGLVAAIPRPLELAARVARVDPDASRPDDVARELTFGANWFFDGHSNKLTLELSRLTLEQSGGQQLERHRVRLQWDLSF